jgi:hypothetical protein
MKHGDCRLVLALAALLSACASGPTSTRAKTSATVEPSDGIPAPDIDRVDHRHPERYLEVGRSLGDPEAIRKIANRLRRSSDEESLVAIHEWMRSALRRDPTKAYAPRNFTEVVESGSYGGCADHSLVFGSLTRALGIPTIWVKTMDADWIREFVHSGGKVTSWRGHVFLEVFVERHWMLLDAEGLVLYRDYDPRTRLLPNQRFAYDKGGDPGALILSTDWSRWKRQTRRFFTGFDLSQLPVPRGDALNKDVFIVADRPVYQWLTDYYAAAGRRVKMSFNEGFETHLAKTQGETLVVTVIGDHYVLPERYWPERTGVERSSIERAIASGGNGKLERVLPDGTHVLVLFAQNESEMKALVDGLPRTRLR